jgi:hypothetical protein
MKTSLKILVALSFLFALTQQAWTDRIDDLLDTDVQSSIDNSFAEAEFNSLQQLFEVEAEASDDVRKNNAGTFCPCSTVDVEAGGDGTYKMTVDFGSGCLCRDGRTRSGKLIGIFSDKWSASNVSLQITPEDYEVTNLLGTTWEVDFVKEITKTGPNNAGQPSWTVKVQDASMVSDQGSITWNSERTTSLVEGAGDLDFQNNVYETSGTASGINLNGLAYDAEISVPLRIEADCAHITQGVWSLTPEDKATRTIDYGDGTCDNKATFSLGNFTKEITLR